VPCGPRASRWRFYYSLYEWFHPLYPSDAAYWGLLPKMDPINPFTSNPCRTRAASGDARVRGDHMLPQLFELVDGYRPDLLWFDGGWDRPESYWRTNEVIAHFYNQAFRKAARSRSMTGGGEGSMGTSRLRSTRFSTTSGSTTGSHSRIGFSFGYNQFETEREYLSSDQLVDMLVDVVSKNGNLLLNIGPRQTARSSPSWKSGSGTSGNGSHKR